MQKRVVTMMTRYGGDMVRGVVVGVRVLTVADLFFFIYLYLSLLFVGVLHGCRVSHLLHFWPV